ncbi:predicted protein [Aspergillus terreus NIH2624]|uniref:Protein kinase domain-containing protein n=1 Tax=Aspergillus terreus (strain NIH 2624 / FGSC A1156) TaxID=341663 RepID=Q0CRJ2_ASPTN|nr:uncharacterized protein ATEG_03692 [Aspergillus terreus NIH2624]EAU35494.1 predicted protein [Aspergillus terreus NIH2624]
MNPQLGDIVLKKLEGTELTAGANVYHLDTLVSEKRDDQFAERRAVFYATRGTDNIDAVVKVRVQDPVLLLPDERQDNIEWAKRVFQDEVRAIRNLQSIEGLPTLLDNGVKTQGPAYEYPGGYMNCIAMSRVRGKPALDYLDLIEWEGSHIKREVTRILESVTCLAHCADMPKEESNEFTENSGVVHQFGQDIWWT